VEFRVTEHLCITSNTIVTIYDENDQGITVRTDFHLRLTLFTDFE
jgi:hypothetical protein